MTFGLCKSALKLNCERGRGPTPCDISANAALFPLKSPVSAQVSITIMAGGTYIFYVVPKNW
jgi:hypothetical protein